MARSDDRSKSWLDRDLRSVMEDAADRWWARFPGVLAAARTSIAMLFIGIGTIMVSDVVSSGEGQFRAFVGRNPRVFWFGFLAWFVLSYLVCVWPLARPKRALGPVGTALDRIGRGVLLGVAGLILVKAWGNPGIANLYLLAYWSLLWGVEIIVRDCEL